MKHLPENLFPPTPCFCTKNNKAESCICHPLLKALHYYAGGSPMKPMDPVQRQWCIDYAGQMGEGEFPPEKTSGFSDNELAAAVLMTRTSRVLSGRCHG